MTDERDDDDVLDVQQARRFAWRIEAPADDVNTAPAPPKAEAPLPTSGEREIDPDLAREIRAFRSQIERVWAMSPAKQPAATITLLDGAARLGLRLVALGGDPAACVRLARLFTRHFGRLPRHDRLSHVHGLSWLTLAGPELGALLVEVARRGERDLSWMVTHGVRERAAWRAATDAVPELARLLAEAPRWSTRELCIRYLCGIGSLDAVAAVRRALRLPHLGCRWLALSGLEPQKGELTEDDVRFVLEDALPHPLERGFGERQRSAFYGYPQRIVEALAFVRPEGGYRPLEAILDGEGACIRRDRVGLDHGWAIVALAKGWPDRAVPRVRRACSRGFGPWHAIDAAACLPEPDARALLTWMSSAADADVAERARKAFHGRFGHEPELAEEDGLPLPFESPPSEAALARLAVLRGASQEAKAALVPVLLAEAPDREAATLLLFLVGRSWSLHWLDKPGIPRSFDAWAKLLIERFGAPALEGIVRLAERDAAAGVRLGWMWDAVGLERAGLLDAAAKERLRAAAVAAFTAPVWRANDDTLFALSILGAPRALASALFSIAIDAPPEDPYFAGKALAGIESDPELDAHLLREADAAIAAEDWTRAERLLSAGYERALDGAYAIAERLLAQIDRLCESRALVRLARTAVHRLHEAGRLDGAWVDAALREPVSLRFELGCCLVGREATGAQLASLRAALASEGRGGAAAACAASRLVWIDQLAPDDARVDALLRTSGPPAAAQLIGAVAKHRRLAELAPVLRRVLASEDLHAASSVLDDLDLWRPDDYHDLLADALAKDAIHRDLRDIVGSIIGEPSEAELYWQDDPDEGDGL